MRFATAARSAALVALIATGAAAARAGETDGPRPPCGGPPVPGYPRAGAPPTVALWRNGDLAAGWATPACFAPQPGGFLALVGLAGRLGQGLQLDAILARIGKISSLAGLRYWSISDQRWQVLVTRATAIEDAASRRPRPDFTASELRSGRELYFLQEENRLGEEMVYRLHLDQIAAGHAVLSVENVSPLRRFMITVMAPGELTSVYYLDRAKDGGWLFYSLLRVGQGGSMLGWLVRPGSYLNRAVAFYRHFAGIAPDADPPAARQ